MPIRHQSAHCRLGQCQALIEPPLFHLRLKRIELLPGPTAAGQLLLFLAVFSWQLESGPIGVLKVLVPEGLVDHPQ